MFGYMLFKNGENAHRTPEEFQKRARQDVESHVRKFKTPQNATTSGLGIPAIGDHARDMHIMDIDVQTEHEPQHHIQSNISHNKRHANSSISLVRRLKHKKNNTLIEPETSPLRATVTAAPTPLQPYTPQLTYGSSPLRKTLADTNHATVDYSSDDCSTIDSGKSGCSLSHESARHLLHQQKESLDRMLTRASTLEDSVFSTDTNSLYTSTTLSTANTDNNILMGHDNTITLDQALPKDFKDYYSPDLEVEKFSNGRPVFTKRPLKNWELNDLRSLLIYPEIKPEWNGKLPNVLSPYPNINFRIQIIPSYLSDDQISQYLAHSDIYTEAKYEMDFKLKTATYIVDRARLRHKQIMIDSFGIDASNFNEKNLLQNIQYDSYFKFEWRNIIENYMLNLGIEYECRTEFKTQISKLKKIANEKRNLVSRDKSKIKNDLYKKVLMENKTSITDEVKMNVWKDVQSHVYRKLNMEGWEVN